MEMAKFAKKKKTKSVRTGEEDIVTSTSLSEDARCKFYHLHSTKCDGKGIVCDKDSFCVPKTHKCKRRHVHTYFGLFYPEPLVMLEVNINYIIVTIHEDI